MDRTAIEGITREAAEPAQGATSAPAADAPQVDQRALDAAEAQAWAQIPASFGKIISLAFPHLADAYDEKNCTAWGEQMVEVARRHGWTSKSVGPWVGLALASVPMVIPTYIAMKLRRTAGASGAIYDGKVDRPGAGAGGDVEPADDAAPRPHKVAPIEG